VIDLHSHILPRLDDGTASLAEAVELARQAAAEGVSAMAATPHVRDDYPTSADAVERGLAELRSELAAARVPVELLPGGELDAAYLGGLDEATLRRFSLAGGPYVLVEFPYRGWPRALEGALTALRAAGLTALLAHPERNPEVQDRPEHVEVLVDAGALVQVTGASLSGLFGRRAQAAARRLLALRLAHVLASDTHGPGPGEPGLAAALCGLDDELADYLTREAPAAIVAGEPVPPPPAPPARTRSLRRLRVRFM
jgi:protein-tyrosine phosphatase